MSTPELKNLLIEKIRDTEDLKLLEDALRLLQLETEDDDVYKLNEEQKTAIQIAREEIKTGKSFSNNEVEREMDEWLNK